MSNLKLLLLYLLISVGIPFYSCSDETQENHKQYKPVFSSQKGTKYHYTLTNTTKIDVEANDKRNTTVNKSEIGLFYEVVKDSAGLKSVKITYDKLRIVKQPVEGPIQEYDSEDTVYVYDPIIKLLKNIKGNSLVLQVDTSGNIVRLEGNQELLQKITADFEGMDLSARKQLDEQLSRLAGEEFAKANLQQSFKLLPDTAIREGDSWTKKLAQEGDVKFEAAAKYTLESVKNNVATIKQESVISDTKKSSINMMGYRVVSAMKGSQEGEYKIDVKTGMLLNGESVIKMEGTMSAMGQEIPVTVRINKEITAKQL